MSPSRAFALAPLVVGLVASLADQRVTPALPPVVGPPADDLRTIVIDPGHGGEDAGVRGAGDTVEKTLALDLARRVKTAIEARLGVRVVLTREDDRAMGLDARAAIANNSHADLFISLHANGSVRPAAVGAEIYSLSPDGRAAAAPPGAADAGPVLAPGVELVPWERAQTPRLLESAALAAAIAEAGRGTITFGVNPVRQAPLRVLVGAMMPAVLVEAGYLTNADEAARLATDEYTNAFARALVDAVVRFRDRASAPYAPAAPAMATPSSPIRPPGARGLDP